MRPSTRRTFLGAGFSDRPRGIDHSMRGTALRVFAIRPKLGLSSFDLLGTSRGGAVAMCAAAECLCRDRAGVRLRRLILPCPVNPYSSHGHRLAPFFGTRVGAGLFRAGLGKRMPCLFPFFHGRIYADRSRIPPGSLDGYKAPLAIPGLFEHGLSIVKTWTADLRELEDSCQSLRKIPTLLMWGTRTLPCMFRRWNRWPGISRMCRKWFSRHRTFAVRRVSAKISTGR